MARSDLGRRPTSSERLVHNGSLKGGLPARDGAAGLSPGGHANVSGSPGDSQDMPIVLDDDEPDSELDAAASDDDHRSLEATPPAHPDDSHPSIPDIPAKSANGRIVNSTADGANAANSNRDHGDQNVGRHALGDKERRRQWHGPFRPHSEATAESDGNAPLSVPPASAGHIHNAYAGRERTSGTGSVGHNPGEQKRQGPSSPRRTDIRDGFPSLTSPSGESVHGEHPRDGPDRIVSPSPTEVAGDGLYDVYCQAS